MDFDRIYRYLRQKSVVANVLRNLRFKILFCYYKRQQKIRVYDIRRKKQANVVFVVPCLAMWKYQYVYELLSQDRRFNVKVILAPFVNYSIKNAEREISLLKQYFNERGIPYDIPKTDNTWDFHKEYNADIIFYSQTGSGQYANRSLCIEKNYGRLICYAPYSICTICMDFVYNSDGDNFAWKYFQMTESHKIEAQKISRTKGYNIEIVGYTNANQYLKSVYNNVWKQQSTPKKRIIYAPHYTIKKGLGTLNRSSFLSVGEIMLELAMQYQDEFQFCFKPHPLLRTILYDEPGWGKERTDNYYEKWNTMSNTQLLLGDYVDLFMTSDAMIHDSAGFTAEYHYTNKPVLFTTNNPEAFKVNESLGILGSKAFDLHYKGSSKNDIINFLIDVVLNGKDPLKEERADFRQQYLLPPSGTSAGENIYHSIVVSLFK